jgi:hypothetical protein
MLGPQYDNASHVILLLIMQIRLIALNPSTLGSELLRQAQRWTLGRLPQVVKATSAPLPSGLNKYIALRNAATHKQAKKPTKDVAVRMVEGTEVILLLTAPLATA